MARAKVSSAPIHSTLLLNMFFIKNSILPSAIVGEGRSALAVKFCDKNFGRSRILRRLSETFRGGD